MTKTRTVTKGFLVNQLAKNTGIPQVQARFIYDSLFDTMRKELMQNRDMVLPGIGRFEFLPTKERRSNLTGQTIPPHKRINFKANLALSRFVRVNTREYKI